MSNDYVLANVRRANQNLLIANGLLFLIVAGVGFASLRYLHNFFAGPFERDIADLASVTDPDDERKYFCRVTAEKVFESGLQEILQERDSHGTVTTKETPQADYLVLLGKQRLLIVKAPVGRAGERTFVGKLCALPPELRGGIVDVTEDPDARAAFLPMMLDATGFRGPGYWMLGIGVPLLMFSARNVGVAVSRRSDPRGHPIYRKLAKYGDVDDVVARIHDDVEAVGAAPFERLIIAPNWILRRTVFGLQVTPLDDVVWVYQKKIVQKTYFIKTGESYEVRWHLRNGREGGVGAKQENALRILEQIHGMAPWVIVGHTAEIQALWSGRRAEFIALVDERRASLLSAGASDAERAESATDEAGPA